MLDAFTLLRRPFSRSYGASLPNSLTKVLPFALVFSTRLPVSVCGTGTQSSTLRGFSWQFGPTHLWPEGHRRTSQAQDPDLPGPSSPYRLSTGMSNTRLSYPPASPLHSDSGGTGILTCCPSPTPFGLGLGPTNPTRTNLASEPLGLRRYMVLTCFSLLMPAFSLLSLQYVFTVVPSSLDRTLPYHSLCEKIPGFGVRLSPVTFSAQDRLTSELLRTL